MLSRVNTLEEGKGGPKNDTEERAKIESALTSLHQRISELEKGNRQGERACSWPGSLCQRDLAWGPDFLQKQPGAPLPLQPFPTPLQPTAPHAVWFGLPVGVTGGAGVPGLWLSLWKPPCHTHAHAHRVFPSLICLIFSNFAQ